MELLVLCPRAWASHGVMGTFLHVPHEPEQSPKVGPALIPPVALYPSCLGDACKKTPHSDDFALCAMGVCTLMSPAFASAGSADLCPEMDLVLLLLQETQDSPKAATTPWEAGLCTSEQN